MATTLDNLRIRARDRADMTDSEFIDDSELDNFINNSLGELYDLLILQYGNENFLDAYQFNTVAGQDRYDLPTDHYKFFGIDLEEAGTAYSLTKFVHADRLLYKNEDDRVIDGVPRFRYRLRDGHFNIYPSPEKAHSCTLWYIRQIPKLVNSNETVTLSIVESWLEYVEVDAAIKMLQKEETDATELVQQKQFLIQRISQAAAGRDSAQNEPTPDSGITLFNLRTQCRYRTGLTGSDLISDREINHYINQSLGELHDLLIKAYGNDYFLDAYQFDTVSGSSEYNLPANFYKVGGVDVTQGSEKYTLSRYNFNERNIYENTSVYTRFGVPYYRYRIQNQSIKLLPTPSSADSITVWYAPQLTKLVNDQDLVDDAVPETWLEYVYLDVGIKMLTKSIALGNAASAGPLQVMQASKMAMIQRVNEMAENRDWANPETVTDVSRSEWEWDS